MRLACDWTDAGALAFDLKCSERLLIFDNERGKAQSDYLAWRVGVMVLGEAED